jgi:hypothetical protein
MLPEYPTIPILQMPPATRKFYFTLFGSIHPNSNQLCFVRFKRACPSNKIKIILPSATGM